MAEACFRCGTTIAETKKNEKLTDVNTMLREKLSRAQHEACRLSYKLPEVDEVEDAKVCIER